VRCKFCSVSGHTKKHNGLGCHHVWGSSILEQQEAGYHCGFNNGSGVSSLWCGSQGRAVTIKALGELASLSGDFPLVGPVLISCDNKAALSLCQDRKEGQMVKHIDIIHHFARDHVASGELKFVYCKSEDNVSDCLTKGLPRFLF
jgi:hypothetical protein